MTTTNKIWVLPIVIGIFIVGIGAVSLRPRHDAEALHREAKAIAREYGFVEVQKPVRLLCGIPGYAEFEFYEARGLSESQLAAIKERLDTACYPREEAVRQDDPRMRVWKPPGTRRTDLTLSVGTNASGDVVSMDVFLMRKFGEPSLLERLMFWK